MTDCDAVFHLAALYAVRGDTKDFERVDVTGTKNVRDVARGHLLAWDRGRGGERYLLGAEDKTLGEVFALIARAAGRKPPRVRVPYAAARAGAALGLLNRQEIALARLPMWFSSEKA